MIWQRIVQIPFPRISSFDIFCIVLVDQIEWACWTDRTDGDTSLDKSNLEISCSFKYWSRHVGFSTSFFFWDNTCHSSLHRFLKPAILTPQHSQAPISFLNLKKAIKFDSCQIPRGLLRANVHCWRLWRSSLKRSFPHNICISDSSRKGQLSSAHWTTQI